jgi:hypothetical protein
MRRKLSLSFFPFSLFLFFFFFFILNPHTPVSSHVQYLTVPLYTKNGISNVAHSILNFKAQFFFYVLFNIRIIIFRNFREIHEDLVEGEFFEHYESRMGQTESFVQRYVSVTGLSTQQSTSTITSIPPRLSTLPCRNLRLHHLSQ